MTGDRTRERSQPRKRRIVKLSAIQRLQIGAQCAEEARKTGKDRARQDLHKRSKFASWINDELKVLKARNLGGEEWRKAVKQHARPWRARVRAQPLFAALGAFQRQLSETGPP